MAVAEIDKRHYNLRSGVISVQLPVQIHMASDSEFVSKLSENQQNSDADGSASFDLNYSAIVESSDDEQNPSIQNKQSTSSTLAAGVHCWMLPLSRRLMYRFLYNSRQLVTD